jgi:23S rRNA (pseudouridine1915-N3)-methyltransferase
MRIIMAAVGRLRSGPTQALFDAYRSRLVWPLEVREVQERRPSPAHERKVAEGSLLLQVLRESGPLIAMDERGDDITSHEFAEQLAAWRDHGERTCAFAIGGADGLDERVRQRATRALRFGRQTWPHLLVRVMLAEQLYRAQQILAGHPYHRN